MRQYHKSSCITPYIRLHKIWEERIGIHILYFSIKRYGKKVEKKSLLFSRVEK